MSNEDAYIYNIAHLHRHFTISGCGVRNILDLHLLGRIIPPETRSYIETELKKLNLTQFEKDMTAIAAKWFEKNDTESFSETELYILSSGAYGTKQNLQTNEKQGKTKLGYLFLRLFPNLKWMQSFYAPLIKRPYLLPFYYVYRIIRAPFIHKKR
jgi:hypothetical protein